MPLIFDMSNNYYKYPSCVRAVVVVAFLDIFSDN